MAVGTGIGFNLDDLDKALKAADKSMERLLQKSGKFSEDMVQNFLEIGSRGVDPFLSKLREQQTALEWLANVKLDGASKQFESLQRSAANALDNNKVVINNMNVFPVADGDTGTNMRITLESGLCLPVE